MDSEFTVRYEQLAFVAFVLIFVSNPCVDVIFQANVHAPKYSCITALYMRFFERSRYLGEETIVAIPNAEDSSNDEHLTAAFVDLTKADDVVREHRGWHGVPLSCTRTAQCHARRCRSWSRRRISPTRRWACRGRRTRHVFQSIMWLLAAESTYHTSSWLSPSQPRFSTRTMCLGADQVRQSGLLVVVNNLCQQ